MGHLQDLLAELRRRRVFRTLLAWGVFSFAVLQVIEPVIHALNLPDWILKVTVLALAAGFPVAAGLGWVFDLTAGGIVRTPDGAATPQAVRRLGGTRLAVLVAALGLLAAAPGVVYFFVWPGAARASGARPAAGGIDTQASSIAVLPFVDMSATHDQEYLADGVAEEILNALAHVQGLKVIGRTSSFSFKGRNEDLRSIGPKLGVANILEGSLRREGDRIRVTAQLIHVADGSHLWSETYDREMTSIFRVQDEISRAVVDALKLKLLPGPALAGAGGTTNPEAYTRLLRARHLMAQQTHDGYLKAKALLEEATVLDPSFSAPHADLAVILRTLMQDTSSRTEVRALAAEAVAEAERAVALGPGTADAHSIRGLLRMVVQRDWVGAEDDLRRALALSPNDATSLRRLGLLRADLGRIDEGIENLDQAARADPLKGPTWAWLGWLQASAGRFEEARASQARFAELAPESKNPPATLAQIELAAGNPSAAMALAGSLTEDMKLSTTAMAQAALGNDLASRQALEELIRKYGEVSGSSIADAFAVRGERDEAFRWLDRALEQGQEIDDVKYDPFLRPLHGDPRWGALLRKLRLPPG